MICYPQFTKLYHRMVDAYDMLMQENRLEEGYDLIAKWDNWFQCKYGMTWEEAIERGML